MAVAPITAPVTTIAVALGVGALATASAFALYITAAHQEGAIRAQSIFAAAPFVGAALSWWYSTSPWGRAASCRRVLRGAIALLTFERHAHPHAPNRSATPTATITDDGHHRHAHPHLPVGVRHTHWHEHSATEHTHPHVASSTTGTGRGSR